MSIGRKGLPEGFLDPDVMYAMWVVTNSVQRAQRRLDAMGLVNPHTGKPPSRMGIWFSAQRSPLLDEYRRRRDTGEVRSSLPTKAEVEQANQIISERLPDLIERSRELYDRSQEIEIVNPA